MALRKIDPTIFFKNSLVLISAIILVFLVSVSFVYYYGLQSLSQRYIEEIKAGILAQKKEYVKAAVDRTIEDIEYERSILTEIITAPHTPPGLDSNSEEWQQISLKMRKRLAAGRIRQTLLSHNGYIWVNQVLNYEGGPNYAIRLVHPNLPETEGDSLSTESTDVQGGTPYLVELEGVKAKGELFFNYWFKKKDSPQISEKITYARLYKEFDWIVASGVYVDDLDDMVAAEALHVHDLTRIKFLWTLLLTCTTLLLVLLIGTLIQRRFNTALVFWANQEKSSQNELRRLNNELEERVRERTHELTEREQWLTMATEAGMVAIWEYDPIQDEVTKTNNYMEMFGLENSDPWGSAEFLQTVHPDDKASIINLMASINEPEGQDNYQLGIRVIWPDKSLHWLTVSGYVSQRDTTGHATKIIGLIHDTTNIKTMEMKFLRAQKMEAIGTLSGGIAHDFNNILSSILGYAELAQSDVTSNSQTFADLDNILIASRRARDLVHQILTFSGQEGKDLHPILPQHVVSEALTMLRASIPTTTLLTSHIDPDCGSILGDSTGLHQMVMNLCTNALHSLKDEKGEVQLTLEPRQVLAHDFQDHEAVAPGDYIVLTVKDDGVGIDPNQVDRIFEPYFTTKKSGAGTGLGLAVTHGIVEDMGGFIRIKTSLGAGSEFSLFFPVIPEKSLELSAHNMEPKELPNSLTGRILLVDDEEQLLEATERRLISFGCSVTTEADSALALEKFQKQPEAFDLVITDQTMPGLSGVELTQQILALRPDLPVILCSGFSNIVNEENYTQFGISCFLSKPFNHTTLQQTVSQILGKNQ